MKIYSFTRDTGRAIEEHGSTAAAISDIANLNEPATVKLISIKTNGLVGSHPAKNPQLLLVVQGKGFVRGEGAARVPIQSGQAVHWDRGEWHETSTVSGLMAIVIESPALDLNQFMPVA